MARDEHELLERIEEAKHAFGCKCSKLAGSVTVEVLRLVLRGLGITLSTRDVFIRGVPVEVDLLLPTRAAKPQHGLVYQPTDVLAAFEVKNSGSFGDDTLNSVRRSFQLIRAANPRVYCAYVTLAERKGYKWAATTDNLGAEVFTLFWHNGSSASRRYEPTGHWEKFVGKLKSLDHG